MLASRTALALLLVLYASFVTSLIWAASILPPEVATHFNAAGVPDGWMSRSTHLLVMSGFGFAFPIFFIAVFWSSRFIPSCLVNIPHRDYWLSPEHRAESAQYLIRHSFWLACLAMAFVIGLNVLVVFSNQRQPVQLPLAWAMLVMGPFLCGVLAWVVLLYRHFQLPKLEP